MTNVVSFCGITKRSLSPDAVLDGAKEEKLEPVIVIGFNEKAELYFSSSEANSGDVLMLLELAKYNLMAFAADAHKA